MQGLCLFVPFWSWQWSVSPSYPISASHWNLFAVLSLHSWVPCETTGRCGGASMGCWPASHQHMCLYGLSLLEPPHPDTAIPALAFLFLYTTSDLDLWCNEEQIPSLSTIYFSSGWSHNTPLQSWGGEMERESQGWRERKKIQTNWSLSQMTKLRQTWVSTPCGWQVEDAVTWQKNTCFVASRGLETYSHHTTDTATGSPL